MLNLARDESGQAMVLTAIFMLGLIAVAGLVADGGLVFVQRRDLQAAADAAAAAGAMQVDEAAYRASAGEAVTLDEAEARTTAAAYLSREGVVDYVVEAGSSGVRVEARRSARTGFLRMLGIREVGIGASAAAEPRHGIAAAER